MYFSYASWLACLDHLAFIAVQMYVVLGVAYCNYILDVESKNLITTRCQAVFQNPQHKARPDGGAAGPGDVVHYYKFLFIKETSTPSDGA